MRTLDIVWFLYATIILIFISVRTYVSNRKIKEMRYIHDKGLKPVKNPPPMPECRPPRVESDYKIVIYNERDFMRGKGNFAAGQIVILNEGERLIKLPPRKRCPFTGVLIKTNNAVIDSRLKSRMHG